MQHLSNSIIHKSRLFIIAAESNHESNCSKQQNQHIRQHRFKISNNIELLCTKEQLHERHSIFEQHST